MQTIQKGFMLFKGVKSRVSAEDLAAYEAGRFNGPVVVAAPPGWLQMCEPVSTFTSSISIEPFSDELSVVTGKFDVVVRFNVMHAILFAVDRLST
jgi:hypothetical protein